MTGTLSGSSIKYMGLFYELLTIQISHQSELDRLGVINHVFLDACRVSYQQLQQDVQLANQNAVF